MSDRSVDFVTVDDAQSTLKAAVSRALASALILGIDHAEEEGTPLTQLQQVHMATMSIMSYDAAIEGCELLTVQLPALHNVKA
jgi:hypothetical protein